VSTRVSIACIDSEAAPTKIWHRNKRRKEKKEKLKSHSTKVTRIKEKLRTS
jgi:hypothetical protein